jgi:Protein of unknown function (DUF732)
MATTTLTKGLKGLLAAGVGAFMLALAPQAVADTNDDAYINAMDENNIHFVGGPADLIYAGHQVCGFLSPSVSPPMVTDYVYRASLYGNRFYTNSLGGSHIPITNGQAGRRGSPPLAPW